MTAKLLLLMAVAAASQESDTTQQIDTLEYRTAAFANKQWIAHTGTPALQTGWHEHKRALIVKTPFATQPKLQRSVVDHPVKLDLSHVSEFQLEASMPHETNYNRISLYFQSGSGWYSGSVNLKHGSWQQLVFKKENFQAESLPIGWHQIDRIRIAIWPPTEHANRDAQVYLRNLAAHWNQIAIVLPDSDQSEWKTSYAVAKRLEQWLEELGLQADRFTESQVQQGPLQQRAVAATHVQQSGRPGAPAREPVEDAADAFAIVGVDLEKAEGTRPAEPLGVVFAQGHSRS